MNSVTPQIKPTMPLTAQLQTAFQTDKINQLLLARGNHIRRSLHQTLFPQRPQHLYRLLRASQHHQSLRLIQVHLRQPKQKLARNHCRNNRRQRRIFQPNPPDIPHVIKPMGIPQIDIRVIFPQQILCQHISSHHGLSHEYRVSCTTLSLREYRFRGIQKNKIFFRLMVINIQQTVTSTL